MAVVTRWFDGLINKDIGITNEIYSLREVDFDRQVSLIKDYAYNSNERVCRCTLL